MRHKLLSLISNTIIQQQAKALGFSITPEGLLRRDSERPFLRLPCPILFISHPETGASKAGKFYEKELDHRENQLTHDGKKSFLEHFDTYLHAEGDNSARTLFEKKLVKVLVSSTCRTQETAELVIQLLRDTHMVPYVLSQMPIPSLDLNTSGWEGKAFSELKSDKIGPAFLQGRVDVQSPAGETFVAYLDRVKNALSRHLVNPKGNVLLVLVGHRSLFAALSILTRQHGEGTTDINWVSLTQKCKQGKPVYFCSDLSSHPA